MSVTITIEDLRSKLESDASLRLIDVRSAGEYASGHVPGAINIPLEEVESRLEDIGDGPVAILCQSGRRAGLACEALASHTDGALLVEGGTDRWMRSGLPVVQSSRSKWSLERQVRLAAGVLVLTGGLLGLFVSSGFIWLSVAVGAGLTFAGITNQCGLAAVLGAMPWNRPVGK